ncbi:MAG: alpha/beta hydrolase [Succinivibrionaceae bacterium]|nr:alpha/beta hydrolase [Succinivibrionaceae bacterium]
MTEHSENLSEILFKPQRGYVETSLISNSGAPLPTDCQLDLVGDGDLREWYRPLERLHWAWSGSNPVDIEEALSCVAAGTATRSRPGLLDTIADYGPGNWNYEFCRIAQRRALRGAAQREAGEGIKAAHEYRLASRYFAIAAYPRLRSDLLASEAMLHCLKAYRAIFACNPALGTLRELEIKIPGDGASVGFLHLPGLEAPQPCPLVICTMAYEQSVPELFRIYDSFLRPHGIAMLALRLPGVGEAGSPDLDQESSKIIAQAVERVRALPEIDGTALLGMGFAVGATATLRAALTHPDWFQGLVVVNPMADAIFTDQKLLNSFPLVLRSSWCNRMNLDASNWETIVPQLQALSLRRQGLLSASGRSQVPTLAVALETHAALLGRDLELLRGTFRNFTLIREGTGKGAGKRTIERLDAIFHEVESFIVERLGRGEG